LKGVLILNGHFLGKQKAEVKFMEKARKFEK